MSAQPDASLSPAEGGNDRPTTPTHGPQPLVLDSPDLSHALPSPVASPGAVACIELDEGKPAQEPPERISPRETSPSPAGSSDRADSPATLMADLAKTNDDDLFKLIEQNLFANASQKLWNTENMSPEQLAQLKHSQERIQDKVQNAELEERIAMLQDAMATNCPVRSCLTVFFT